MITLRLRHIILFTLAFLLTACQFEDSADCPKEENVAASYINLTIAVSNGNSHSRTRVGELPTGGEDGNGREAGFERENAVTGITLILYKDANGINTSSDPTLAFVRYFPVTLGGRDPQGTPYTNKTEEAYYTTGDQPIGRPNLDFSGTYHAIVIANQMLPSTIVEGTSTLSDIRDYTTSIIYSGNATQPASSCVNFVMSSEADNTINFGAVTGTNLDGTTHTKGKDILYNLSSQPLVIERMAARIDFWSKNSNGYKTSEDNAAYTIPGYEYPVYGSATDKFVVTGIVPFNLVNGHATYGNEYLLKRIRTDIDDASTTNRLADETTDTYVLDPMTTSKTISATPTLTSSLESVYSLIRGDEGKSLESSIDNPFYHSIASMHSDATGRFDIGDDENVIVCYPMENCILPQSKLYYHATGIAIVGYYYKNGTGTRYVYLGYLRHQGEDTSYEIQPYTTPLTTDATMGTTTAMNFGIVRNNIYRVSINSVDKKGDDTPKVTLQIKVKKWDKFEHAPIYM